VLPMVFVSMLQFRNHPTDGNSSIASLPPASFLLAELCCVCYWLSNGAVLDVCTVTTQDLCSVYRVLAPCKVRISACI